MSDFPHRPSFISQDVERRHEVRGPVKGLTCALPSHRPARVLEAGRRGFFVALEHPDIYALGTTLEVTVTDGHRALPARVDVVRKEIDPRRGIALLIVHMSPADAATYAVMLGA